MAVRLRQRPCAKLKRASSWRIEARQISYVLWLKDYVLIVKWGGGNAAGRPEAASAVVNTYGATAHRATCDAGDADRRQRPADDGLGLADDAELAGSNDMAAQFDGKAKGEGGEGQKAQTPDHDHPHRQFAGFRWEGISSVSASFAGSTARAPAGGVKVKLPLPASVLAFQFQMSTEYCGSPGTLRLVMV